MITKTGQQILSELRSEQLMAISDKKWWFVFKDVGTVPHFLYKLCLEFGKSIFVYSTTILILLIATYNEHSTEESPNDFDKNHKFKVDAHLVM
ncbi:hypothetical protein [Photobacterium damselae]|uniref:hypothetical protein n=1 Tax=Photobacterium damselae TaxID=38293 RepID=UPI001075FF00|nr:hypothetical protein [Photobacterium damselae]MBE8127733.1 hypothetical protein [Photobacterium damselae subsp. piscicida]